MTAMISPASATRCSPNRATSGPVSTPWKKAAIRPKAASDSPTIATLQSNFAMPQNGQIAG